MLSHLVAEKLAGALGCDAEDLRHAQRPLTRKGRGRKPRHDGAPAGSPVPHIANSSRHYNNARADE